MIKAVIFDFDGTIADTFPIVLKNANRLCRELGLKQIKYTPKLRDKSMRSIIKENLKIPMFKLPKYAKRVKELIKPELKKAKTFRGMKQVLDKLSKKYKTGILTTNSEDTVRAVLKNSKINSVDFIFSDSSIFGKHKKLKRLLKKHKLKKDEMIYVGDEIRDIDACRKIGVRMIAVSWGYNSKKALLENKPEYLVTKTHQLLKILK